MKNKAFKRLIYGTCALLFSLPLFSFKILPDTAKKDSTVYNGYKVKTIVVDAGHGGKRSGASGSYSMEKNVTLALAFKLQKALEKDVPDVKVVMTRTTDEDILWQKRAIIANENKGDLFISLHCNSLSDRTIVVNGRRKRVADQTGKGVLLLVYGLHRDGEEAAAIRENLLEEKDVNKGGGIDFNDPTQMILLNAFKNKYRKQSIRFADILNDEFKETDGRHSDGVREQGLFVLCNSAMPSVLIETGYINNPQEEEYLNSPEGQDEIVATIIRSIQIYKKQVEQSN